MVYCWHSRASKGDHQFNDSLKTPATDNTHNPHNINPEIPPDAIIDPGTRIHHLPLASKKSSPMIGFEDDCYISNDYIWCFFELGECIQPWITALSPVRQPQ
jgi:hypothetical protein